MPPFTHMAAIVIGLFGMATASVAVAQDTDDWDFLVDPERKDLTVAGVQFEGGASLSVQCQGGMLSLFVGGIPMSGRNFRAFSIMGDDGLSRLSHFTRVEHTNLLHANDARAVRFLRTRERITIASSAGELQPMRMQLDLPALSANLDRVLTACGYPLVDSRDDLADVSDLIINPPIIEMPTFSRRYTVVRVEVSCVVSNGRLTACQSDHETPSAPEVGRATAQEANGTRVSLSDPAAAEGRLFDVVVTGDRNYRYRIPR